MCLTHTNQKYPSRYSMPPKSPDVGVHQPSGHGRHVQGGALHCGGSLGGTFRYYKDIIKADDIVVEVDNQGWALSWPMVVLSLTAGNSTAKACAEPQDYVWRAVDISCADEATSWLLVIQGGLAVRGHYYVPTHTGDMLTVEIEPSL